MGYRYQQLERELIEQISSGRIPVGSKLPSIRLQCQQTGFSKATVIHAYERLEAAGFVEVRRKSGYFVSAQQDAEPGLAAIEPTLPQVMTEPHLIDMSDVMRDIMTHNAAFDIAPQMDKRSQRPVGITDLNRCLARALRQQAGSAHQYYDEPAGLLSLRQQIAQRYQRLGCHVNEADVLITAGCQHGLSLALQSCCKPGDIVAVESPGFYGVLQLLESMGLQVLEIPVTAHEGLSIEALSNALGKWEIAACVVTPAFATPLGSVMPVNERKKLIQLAEQFGFTIVEDDIYADLSFGARQPPLKQLDQSQHVILCGSYSKSLSRELRLGWVIASHGQAALMGLKMVNILALSRFTQQGLVEYLNEGMYEKHLRKLKPLLKAQRDQLIELLFQSWQSLGEIRISQPQGGLALWVELEERFNVAACYLDARRKGIVITPGNLFTAQDQFKHCLRISFAHPWNDQRKEAIKRLGAILLQKGLS